MEQLILDASISSISTLGVEWELENWRIEVGAESLLEKKRIDS